MMFEPTKGLKRFFLPVFQRINPGGVTMTHHWTSDKIRLHSFKHKEYWFHGRNRKQSTMELFGRLVSKGDCVLDVGGHIGYTAVYFSYLVSRTGRVYVFEPSPENLTYLARNVDLCPRNNITVVRKAVSDRTGAVTLNCESVTGQNSTLVPDFRALAEYCKRNHLKGQHEACTVEAITIDDFVHQYAVSPRFIKIDIEGAELQALRGMTRTLQVLKPRVMVEVNLNGNAVWRFLTDLGYKMYSDSGEQLRTSDRLKSVLNVFAFHDTDVLANSTFSSYSDVLHVKPPLA